jgi:Glutaredoxin-related protein
VIGYYPSTLCKKEFVGGCDIVKEMYESGELKKVFDKKEINYKK